MMVLIMFWRNLTKKDSGESAKYEIQFFLLLLQFMTFFSRIRIRIFPDRIRNFGRSGSGFWADPYPDFLPIRIWTQENKSDPDQG